VTVTEAGRAWYDQDDFWTTLYPFMFPAWRLESAGEEVEKIVQLTGSTQGALLDLCCGPGRHAVPLALRGFSVTGVDRTLFLLAKAREHAAAEQVEVEWVHEDMRTFRRREAFDLAISMYTSFGFFEDPAENSAVLENVFASLKPGGVFVVDVIGKEVIARIFQPATCREVQGEGLLIERHNPVEGWSQMANEWIVIREGRARSFFFQHWIYSGRELYELLIRAGFSTVKLHGNLDGAPYGPDAGRLIAVARKE
jgi:SAM-dependent methyltransferase